MRSRRPPAAWLLAAALVTVLPGCGLFDDEPQAGPARSPTTTSTLRPGTSLLDPGRAPRRQLRTRFVEGETTDVDLTIDLDVEQRSDGRSQVLPNPPVTETVRFTVDRVRGPEADVSFAFVGASIDRKGSGMTDAEVLALTAELQGLVGIGGHGTLSDRGRFSAFTYDLPVDLDEGLTSTLEQAEDQFATMAVPLPTDPVGVGARWRVDSTAELGGIEVHQSTTYAITAIEGDTVTYEASTSQDAGPQPVDLSGLPAGSTARLVSSELSGTTTGVLDLASVVATSHHRATGTQVIELTRRGAAPQRLDQRVTVAIAIRPAA